MRLYRIVILVNIALGAGYLFGYHFWGQEVIRLNRELATARRAGVARPAGERSWTARGIVRGVMPQTNQIVVTHEEIPELMPPMTMVFRVEGPELLRGLGAGDLIQFTLKERGNQLVLAAIRKDGTP